MTTVPIRHGSLFIKYEVNNEMIKYEFNGIDGEANIEVDLTQAFWGTSSFSSFLSNIGLEVQTAYLAILGRTLDTIDEVTGHSLDDEEKSTIEEFLLTDTRITPELYAEFRKACK